MLVLALLNIHIPKEIISLTSIIELTNGFASMLMIGMMFEIKFRYDYLSKAGFCINDKIYNLWNTGIYIL